jgi:putative intracellular protease/amidase
MTSELKHCTVAILAVDGFEESELTEPQRALTEAGDDELALVRDGNFVSSRKPDDLPAFNAELIACLKAAA